VSPGSAKAAAPLRLQTLVPKQAIAQGSTGNNRLSVCRLAEVFTVNGMDYTSRLHPPEDRMAESTEWRNPDFPNYLRPPMPLPLLDIWTASQEKKTGTDSGKLRIPVDRNHAAYILVAVQLPLPG